VRGVEGNRVRVLVREGAKSLYTDVGFGLLAVELDSSLLTAFRHCYQDRAGGSTRTRALAGPF
jgi:hypothetical protein